MNKVQNTVFPLASSIHRAALITSIVAGATGKDEAEAAVLHDLQPRRHKKPVVAEGIYFESVTAAAKALVARRVRKASKETFFRIVQSEQKRIARMCTEDCWEGYYWAE